MEVDFGVCQFQIEGFLIELDGVDLILGVDWLRTLGVVVVNWDKMNMKFICVTEKSDYKWIHD